MNEDIRELSALELAQVEGGGWNIVMHESMPMESVSLNFTKIVATSPTR
jgi:hypothetical protein